MRTLSFYFLFSILFLLILPLGLKSYAQYPTPTPIPSASISVTPSSGLNPTTVTINWSTTNIPGGHTCSNDWNAFLPITPNTSGQDTRSASSTKTFTISCTNGTTASTTFTLNRTSIGYQDGSDNGTCSTWGWAIDQSNSATSIYIHVYKNGPAGGGGTFVGAYLANQARGDVNAAFGISGDHGFNILFDASSGLYDNASHLLYLYAIDSDGDGNPLLSNTPQWITCSTYYIDTITFKDVNRDGVYNCFGPPSYPTAGCDAPWPNQSVSISGPSLPPGISPSTTNASGYTYFLPLGRATYTVSYSPPLGFQMTTNPSQNISPPPTGQTAYFGIAVPPNPVITSNPPTITCSGNNPVVSFTYFSSSDTTWYAVWDITGSTSTFVQGGPQTSYTNSAAPYSPSQRGQVHQYVVRAYYNAASGQYSETLSAAATIPDCYYSVSGTVFTDFARDGVRNGPDTFYSGATLTMTGQSAATTNGSGAYSFSTLLGGNNYTLTLTSPSTTAPNNTYASTTPNPSTYSFTPLVGSVTTANFGIVPIYTIPTTTPTPGPVQPTPTGIPVANPTPTPLTPPTPAAGSIVFLDNDRSGTYTTGDAGFAGATITLTGTLTYGNPTFTPQTTTTASNGTYSFPNPSTSYLYAGTYATTLTAPATAPATNPARYRATTATTKNNIVLPPNAAGGAFGIVPLYKISGNVFDDYSKDGTKNAGEPNMTDGAEYAIEIRGPVNVDLTTVNGAYDTGTILYAGQYSVTYTSSIPAGYRPTNPANCVGNCSFTVTVGPNCAPNTVKGGICTPAGLSFNASASDITELNFGMTNCSPWYQVIGSNGRVNGNITNNGSTQTGFSDPIPDPSGTASCGGSYASITGSASNTPGIIFSSSTPDFGQGQASPYLNGTTPPYNWQVISSYGPTHSNTSYGAMMASIRQSGITPLSLPGACTTAAGCALDDLNGIYAATGTVTVNASTLKADAKVVILVNGDMYIKGDINLPTCGSLTFSVSGDIYVDATVGATTATSTTANITGFFSTDKSFIIQGTNNSCADTATPDKRLNVVGSVVTNAAGNGGSIQNHRDLGQDNLKCPAFSIANRPDLLLCAPDFIKKKSDVWKEVAP